MKRNPNRYNTIKTSELKDYRRKWHIEQKGICPLLKKKVSFKSTVIDHQHRKKGDPIGGEKNLGLIRGVLHYQANGLEGIITRKFKRTGVSKFIDLPSFLRNLADYLENPPLASKKIIHPSEIKKEVLKKRDFNKVLKHYFTIYPRRKKLPKWPKNGKLSAQMKIDIQKVKELK